ncbi:MAG: hypothetical protein IPM63_18240 [Acidobacteriota bacterium]|nr:MAG: hypothetical protein IPM63_18240 [Acidobacteriota bacterium]
MAGLDSAGFDKFLSRLDTNPDSAAERYEELRLKLTKFFAWKGCETYRADDLTDETLDRIALKVGEGVEVENVNAYIYGVARFVWLEHVRSAKEDPVGDEMPEIEVLPEEPEEEDVRLACLRSCLSGSASDDADVNLVTGYYDPDPGEKIKEKRKRLADELGIAVNTLKVRACRIRARLETCIRACVEKRSRSL